MINFLCNILNVYRKWQNFGEKNKQQFFSTKILQKIKTTRNKITRKTLHYIPYSLFLLLIPWMILMIECCKEGAMSREDPSRVRMVETAAGCCRERSLLSWPRKNAWMYEAPVLSCAWKRSAGFPDEVF